MKKTSIKILVALISVFSLQMIAQKEEIQVIQAIWGMDKKQIVTDYMKFTPAEGTAFWPVYDEYQTELQKLGKERLMTISDYADHLSTLTNEKADELVSKILKNNEDVDKLQAKYYKKMKAVITPLRAAQYIQLDYYLLTMIRAQIQSNIPMIGEIDKTAK